MSIWSGVPWGVVHHHFWHPLNGALFMARDILGNVKISNNYLFFDAYNGIRATVSEPCRASSGCRNKTNIGFEIVGNTFAHIRDNPVEPETHAAQWIVKHNTFVNSHAVISTDGVSGHDLLVFGNVFALAEAPGSTCRDEGWVGSRQFQARRGGGEWSTDTADGDDASCSSHRMGTVVKLGGDSKNPDSPLLERILFFNNSLRTRSPLFRGSPAPPIASYNNAVEFRGCGSVGAISCRQERDPEPSCAGMDFWTRDGDALFADCFPLSSGNGHPLPHEMRFNAYNRLLGPRLDDIDKDRVPGFGGFVGLVTSGMPNPAAVENMFGVDAASPLANGGCRVLYASGNLLCQARGAPVGAILASGGRFDVELPFRFPFTEILRGRGSPR